MNATIPQYFTYRSPNRIDFTAANSDEDLILDEPFRSDQSSLLRRFDPTPRLQVGQITRSKDGLRDWLTQAWKREPTVVRWVHAVHSMLPASSFVSAAKRIAALTHIVRALDDSRRILELKDDWDGQGSIGYTEAVWQRACKFVMQNAVQALNSHSVVIQPPKILPGPDGSIDVHWKTVARELLVNIPGNASEPAEFYGDDYASLRIKGTLDPENPSSALLMWLPENR